MLNYRSLSIALLLLLAVAIAISAQETAKFRVAVPLVTVDITVLDKNGNCPRNLRPDDFEISEDGVRQKIQDFELIVPPEPGPEPAAVGPDRAHAPSVPSKTTPDASPRIFLLVIDSLNSDLKNLLRMKSDLETFIARNIQPDDRVAVVTTGRSVRLLQNLTNDRAVLTAAIRKALESSFEGTVIRAEQSASQQTASQALSASQGGDAMSAQDAFEALLDMARTYSQLNDYSSRNALFTIKELCRSLAPLKGRKTVVLVSEGFGATGPVQNLMSTVVDAANKANVSIYCINPGGLTSDDLVRAQLNETDPVVSLRPDRRYRYQETGRVAAGNSSLDLAPIEMRANGADEGLNELAHNTGGLVVRNSNDYRKAFERAYRDNRSFYQLTYVPANAVQDGRFRRIEVRLRPKGYVVRARSGYFALAREAGFNGSADEQMGQALFSPEELNQLSTALSVARFVSPSGQALACITLQLGHPGTNFVEVDGRYAGEFALGGGVFNDSGTLASSFRDELRLDLDPARYDRFRERGTSITIWSRLPAGRYQVKSVVREKSSGRMGTRREYFEITNDSHQEPSLSSIIVSDSVEGSTEKPQENFNPLAYRNVLITPSVLHDFPREGTLTFFFHIYEGGDETPLEQYLYRLTLTCEGAMFYRSAFAPLSGAAQRVPNGMMLALQLPLSKFSTGSYQGQIEVALPDGRNRVSGSVSFTVR